jgi:Glycoside Hydrolase Family 113
VIDAFKSAGLNIELKISLETYDRTFSGSLAPANVDQWFSEYKAAVLDYARLAQANGITKLIITNELESMTSQYRDKWLDIIDAVRQVYTGEIGVNAVPHESLNLSFGDKLDFIGLRLYPRLTTITNPTVSDLVAAWTHDADGINWVDFVNQVHQKYNKPVEISEIGFESRVGAAADGNDATITGMPDQTLQQNEYDAFFQSSPTCQVGSRACPSGARWRPRRTAPVS